MIETSSESRMVKGLWSCVREAGEVGGGKLLEREEERVVCCLFGSAGLVMFLDTVLE